MQVVVVGAGIVGLASAYYLAEEGADVVVCEKSSVGAGSTARAGGGIRGQFSNPANIELSKRSIETWERFEEAFGVDIQYERPGYLFLARDRETAARLERDVQRQNDHGVPSEFISADEAADVCPKLHAEKFRAASYSPTDGIARPYLALQGFLAGARSAGVDVRTDVAVTGVVKDASGPASMSAVETDDGRITADYVVNATGPWAGEVLSRLGVDLPVRPQRRQVAKVEPVDALPETVPLTVDVDGGGFIRTEGDALGVGGQFGEPEFVDDPDTFDTTMDLDWAMNALEFAAEISGLFTEDSAIMDVRTGLYCVTPDHNPIVEETAPGLINAVGFSGHGFMHAPAVGQVVADLVFDGSTDVVDLAAFSSARFEAGASSAESNFI